MIISPIQELAKSYLGDKSNIGDNKSYLGDSNSYVGDNKSYVGDDYLLHRR